jgi:hypothetical protein
MSGSPILSKAGATIGVACTSVNDGLEGGPNPRLMANLPDGHNANRPRKSAPRLGLLFIPLVFAEIMVATGPTRILRLAFARPGRI